MNKLGYVRSSQAQDQFKNAKTDAIQTTLKFDPLNVVSLFVRDCRKFNFKVVSIEPNAEIASQNAEKLALHIGECVEQGIDSETSKDFSNKVLPLIKVVEDKSLLY